MRYKMSRVKARAHESASREAYWGVLLLLQCHQGRDILPQGGIIGY